MEKEDDLHNEIEDLRLLSHYVNRNKKRIVGNEKKKIGAQKGHKGHSRHIPERIDNIKIYDIEKCPNCNNKIKGKIKHTRSRYITDINIFNKVKNIRYDINRKYCKKCKKVMEPEIPHVLPHMKFGLNIMYFVTYLKLALKLSWSNVREYIQDIYDIRMSGATPILFMKAVAHEKESAYNHMKERLKKSRVIHADETRWPIKGIKWWVWLFSSDNEAVFLLCKNRDHKIPAEFLKDYRGTLVCDFYSAYEKIKCKQQKCIVHLLREFQKQLKNAPYDTELREMIKSFLDIIRPIIYELKEESPNYEWIKSKKGEIRLKIKQLIKKEYISKSANTFKKRFKKHLEGIIRFMGDPTHIDWNNNKAERDLRPLCIQRSISKNLQSENASNSYLQLFSIYQTCEKRNIHFLKFLQSKRDKIPKKPIKRLEKHPST